MRGVEREVSGSHWGTAHNARDRDVIDHMLTCPRCAELCDPDCRYCAECGSRLLPKDAYLVEPLDAPYPDELHSEADADTRP